MAENNEVVKIGTILKDKRIELGVTREQVAERSGISARYLIAIENEEKIPRIPVLKRILQSVGLSADAVLFPENAEKDPESIRLLRLLESCHPRDQKVIAAMIDAMIDNRSTITAALRRGPQQSCFSNARSFFSTLNSLLCSRWKEKDCGAMLFLEAGTQK